MTLHEGRNAWRLRYSHGGVGTSDLDQLAWDTCVRAATPRNGNNSSSSSSHAPRHCIQIVPLAKSAAPGHGVRYLCPGKSCVVHQQPRQARSCS